MRCNYRRYRRAAAGRRCSSMIVSFVPQLGPRLRQRAISVRQAAAQRLVLGKHGLELCLREHVPPQARRGIRCASPPEHSPQLDAHWWTACHTGSGGAACGVGAGVGTCLSSDSVFTWMTPVRGARQAGPRRGRSGGVGGSRVLRARARALTRLRLLVAVAQHSPTCAPTRPRIPSESDLRQGLAVVIAIVTVADDELHRTGTRIASRAWLRAVPLWDGEVLTAVQAIIAHELGER